MPFTFAWQEANLFKDITFPDNISYGAEVGDGWLTDVVQVRSGHEQRIQQWAEPLLEMQVGHNIKNWKDLQELRTFARIVEGQTYSFRVRDHSDYTSSGYTTETQSQPDTITKDDVEIGVGDAAETIFQIIKKYTFDSEVNTRTIRKPISGTLLVALNGALQTETTHYTVDYLTGLITFVSPPGGGVSVTCGYEFDVPMRFVSDKLNTILSSYNKGSMPDIGLREQRAFEE